MMLFKIVCPYCGGDSGTKDYFGEWSECDCCNPWDRPNETGRIWFWSYWAFVYRQWRIDRALVSAMSAEERLRKADPNRKLQWEPGWTCPTCKLVRPENGHDPCLGELPGVLNACCGHGGIGAYEGYVQFENGQVLRFDNCSVDAYPETGS